CRGSEQIRALEGTVGIRQPLEVCLDDRLEESERLLEGLRGDRAMARRFPGDEELLEDLVEELSPLARAQPGVLVALLFKSKHVAGEILEWTVEIPLDVAD